MAFASIRWRGRDAVVDERELESLVRAGLVPEDAWIISPAYTKGHAIRAGELEVFHLWRPDEEPGHAGPPAVLGEIYLRRGLSMAVVLLALNLAVSFVLLIRWRGAYPYELAEWASAAKNATSGWWDLPHMLAPTLVHSTPQHLFGNLLYLFAFGAVLEYALGAWRTLLVYVVAGYGGSVCSYLLLESSAVSVGASGAIFGLIGGCLVYLLRHQKTFGTRLRWRTRRIFIPLVLAVTVYSLSAGNLWAHAGGLLTGALAGFLLDVGGDRAPSGAAAQR